MVAKFGEISHGSVTCADVRIVEWNICAATRPTSVAKNRNSSVCTVADGRSIEPICLHIWLGAKQLRHNMTQTLPGKLLFRNLFNLIISKNKTS